LLDSAALSSSLINYRPARPSTPGLTANTIRRVNALILQCRLALRFVNIRKPLGRRAFKEFNAKVYAPDKSISALGRRASKRYHIQAPMLLYAITNRALLAESETERAEKLVALASRWSASGVDFIQIREKELDGVELIRLSSSVVRAARSSGKHAQVLINAASAIAASIALESEADGVHLSGGLDAAQLAQVTTQIRKSWRIHRGPSIQPAISVSCHSILDIQAARAAGATLALFAPVFEKVLQGSRSEGAGLQALEQACRAARQPASQPEMAVLALGGVTRENASQCMSAGAAGVAAIRLFLEEGNYRNRP
jgi:thiamine-phosphate pyrophosphorylase